jgi:hypothetical protein
MSQEGNECISKDLGIVKLMFLVIWKSVQSEISSKAHELKFRKQPPA